MKKCISMVALVVLVMTMAMGASAADPTGVPVLTFDTLKVGSSLTHDENGKYVGVNAPGVAFDDQNTKDKDVKWYSTIVANGQSGNGVQMPNMKHTAEHNTLVQLNKVDNVTNWTGAKNLYFYVDCTGWVRPRIRVLLRFGDLANTKTLVQFYLESARSATVKDRTDLVYYQDASGNWKEVPEMQYNSMVLPANYKGWVKIPINNENWDPQWWGGFNDRKILDHLGSATHIGISVVALEEEDKDKTVMLDSFMVEGITAPTTTTVAPTTTAAPTTTTAAPTTTTVGGVTTTTVGGVTTTTVGGVTTTAKGSATGEAAIPALLLVALPVSAGVVFACKKRSK